MAEKFTLTSTEYLRSFLCAIWFILILIFTLVTAVPLFILSGGYLRDWINTNFGYLIGSSCLKVLGIKVVINYKQGKKPEGPAIFMINHSSTLDLFVLLYLKLPKIRFVAKKEFQYNPLFLILGNMTDHIFIDRSSSAKAVETLQNAIAKIRRNKLSVLFAPEGSRNHPGIIGPFKRGAFHMAVDSGLSIEPIYIENARTLCPGGATMTKTGTVTVTFHETIDTSDWHESSINEYIEETRNKFLEWAGVKEDLVVES